MQLKEFLIKKLSLKLNVPEHIINTVISNQFQTAFQATTNHNTIELSGFGKFVFSQYRGKHWMNKYLAHKLGYEAILSNPDSSPELVHNTTLRLATINKNIEHLKPKLIDYEPKSDI